MPEKLVLPNVRKLFIPDPGYVLFEGDLAGADAQVVAWEAEDEDLKAAFRAGLDVHAKNAEDMFGAAFTKLQGHARDEKRQQNKRAVHATNYVGTARTLAITLGWTVHEADQFQKRWFSLHPGIQKNFHGKIRSALATSRTVVNKLGFRRVYFDRIEECLPEAVAWIPQSTVALVTYQGAFQLEEQFHECQILLQCHDSLVFQFPLASCPAPLAIRTALANAIPYADPLTIQWGLSRSEKSWGDCQKIR